jgi:hypothetical protein
LFSNDGPSLMARWTVDGATPSTAAAFRIVIDSPSAGADDGRKRGIFQCRRKLPTLLASKR